MKKREASITPKVLRWFSTVVEKSCLVEVKHTRGSKTFSMSEIAEHQYDWLLASTTDNGCRYKMPDSGFGANPCDAWIFKKAKAYVIIVYPSNVYAIEIRDIMKLKKPSLDEATALKLSEFTTKLQDL